MQDGNRLILLGLHPLDLIVGQDHILVLLVLKAFDDLARRNLLPIISSDLFVLDSGFTIRGKLIKGNSRITDRRI